ncbi:STAS domain-containing protein [Chondromyces apiculatus]|uniref:STAS domain-containing protein n=1 Tax=Chondromyces apiculatus DSM 436 TaxID=1192034 RepID=A0A017T4K5_9BACT|nr:STAS domain-containing protein [Chondromyces apiculatus]EYF04149.1 Hypothetical protein CAP_4832 [Chondromyces apiculatus DSM 436]
MASSDDAQSPEALRQELDTLRREKADLERALKQREIILQAFLDHFPGLAYVKEIGAWTILFMNRTGTGLLGTDTTAIRGKAEDDLAPPEVVTLWRQSDLRLVESGAPTTEEYPVVVGGDTHQHRSVKFVIPDEHGAAYAIGGFSTDVTAQRRAEERLAAAYRDTLQKLSAPVIPITRDTVVVPLIGALDATRVQQITEGMLETLSSRQASLVILDATGAGMLDIQASDALIKAARGARLLGAEVVMTGISPATAQALVEFGAHLDGIKTLGSLQDGVAYALTRRR